jgi:hypothetical protein
MKRLFVLSMMLGFCHLPTLADTAPGLVNTRTTNLESDNRYLAYEEACKTKILNNFNETTAPQGFTLLFKIQKDGIPTDISVFDTSKDGYFDVLAIESLLTSCPLEAPPAGKTLDFYDGLLPSRVDFKPQKVSKSAKNRNLEVHAIPLEVANRYPGIFTKDELSDRSNMVVYQGELPKPPYEAMPGTSHDHTVESVIGKDLTQYFSAWMAFFAEHKTASREELSNHRDFLLQKLKTLKRVSASSAHSQN